MNRDQGRALKYGELLKHPSWQRKRLEILQRDQFTCRLCGDEETTLHVHHLRYDRGADPWDYPDTVLVTVCENCHEYLHAEKIGESLLEALIAGGAKLEQLYDFQLVFQGEFIEGPRSAGPSLSAGQWDTLITGLTLLLRAVRDSDDDIHVSRLCKALELPLEDDPIPQHAEPNPS